MFSAASKPEQLSEEQMRELLGRAAIYIATSRYEPFGLAPLEAALSRCALVANDIPSLRELWGRRGAATSAAMMPPRWARRWSACAPIASFASTMPIAPTSAHCRALHGGAHGGRVYAGVLGR